MLRRARLLLLVALLAPLASAHATLESAVPPPNGRGEVGLTQIEVRFTEDVERDYTNVDIVDSEMESWAAGPVEFDAQSRSVVRLPTRPLADGLYVVSWKALSADTHTTRGTYVFAVGSATLQPGQYAPVVEEHGGVARDGFARFAFYAGLFLALGMPLFALVVLRDQPPPALFRTAASFGIVGVAAAAVGLLFLGERTELGWGAASTAPGQSLVWRGALLAGATLACVVGAARPAAARGAAVAAVAMGGLAALATAFGSHAAAVKENTLVYVAADALHLLMGAVWIGGVVAFLHVGWGRTTQQLSAMVMRFSPLAVASVVLLLATGGLASIAHMPCVPKGPAACLDALRTEPYVRLVALKLALMAPLIALGAFNKYRAGPGLQSGAWSARTFRRVVQAEAALMALILGAAGILAASAPPQQEMEGGPASTPQQLEMENLTRTSHVILQVSPNPVTVGVQKLVFIVHPLGATLPNSTQVAFNVQGPGEREPETIAFPEKVTPNEWEAQDAFFTSPGTWRVNMILQRPDEYVKIPFDITVEAP